MSAAATAFLDGLLAGRPAAPAAARGWLADLRAAALERANALTLPTTRDEDWRFTDLSALYALAFKPAAAGRGPRAARWSRSPCPKSPRGWCS